MRAKYLLLLFFFFFFFLFFLSSFLAERHGMQRDAKIGDRRASKDARFR